MASFYRFVQRQAHEYPVYFWSFVIGGIGPLGLVFAAPIRRSVGYVTPEKPPYTYPVPQRARHALPSKEFDDPPVSPEVSQAYATALRQWSLSRHGLGDRMPQLKVGEEEEKEV